MVVSINLGVPLVNQALDQIAAGVTVRSMDPPDANSLAAEVAARTYAQQVGAVFRSVHWNCARFQKSLTLLRAAAGTYANADGSLPVPPIPWLYEYAYPTDCLKIRFLIPKLSLPATSTPLMTGAGLNYYPDTITAMPFVPALSLNDQGQQVSVILTNAPMADAVYTAIVQDPNLWDVALRNAVIATLSAWFVNPLARNAELLKERVQMAVAMIQSARISDGNEGITSTDHLPDWMAARNYGSTIGIGAYDNGYMAGWDSIGMPDGMSY